MTKALSHGRREWVLSALDEFEGPLLRYARRVSGDLDLARDIVQHAFLRLCDQDPVQLDGRLAAWLYTVCRNRAIDLKRRDMRLEPLANREGAEGAGRECDPADWLETQDAGDALRGAVATLPTKQQDVVNLWSEGFTYREISQITGDREGYVRVLAHRAIVALREHATVKRLLGEDNRSRRPKAIGERGA
jgi:RNA polymerase sigma-70 factor (ECF subfamily)